jgi:uncharacterized Zn-binding protein involved in type VI secretion
MPNAARVGDLHTCPMTTGMVPHVGGPVMPPGQPNVLICGMPAARISDMVTCAGPPDLIVMGSPTVLIGGKPASRMGDSTAHGGVITVGAPTVVIEGGSVVAPIQPFTMKQGFFGRIGEFLRCVFSSDFKVSPNITISGSLSFRLQALADLRKLYSTNSGRALLNSIETSGHSLTITEATPGKDSAWDGNWTDPNLYNGTGTNAFVQYNPNQSPMYNNGSAWDNPDPAVTLGHELCHASHISNGNLAGDPTSGSTVTNDPSSGLPMNRALEERRTVGAGANATHGIPDYSNEPFSENSIRSELGEPQRTTYLNPDDNLW